MYKIGIWLWISLAIFSALSCDSELSNYKKLKVSINKHSTANTTDDPSHGEIHAKGVNIIGSCENPNCAAHGEKVVLNLGYGDFKIIQRGQMTFKSSCPVCNSPITPKSSAFNNCYCRVKSKTKPGRSLATPWKSAGECPKKLDLALNDIDNYVRLTVKAINLDVLPIEEFPEFPDGPSPFRD